MSAAAAAVVLDEGDVRRTATERLDAEGTSAGVPVEDPRARDARRQDVEQRLAQLVGRGPHAFPLRRLQPAALELPGDHAHVELPTSNSQLKRALSRQSPGPQPRESP